MIFRFGLTLLVLVVGTQALAQEVIPLNAREIDQLGIIFAPVSNMDRQVGSRFPATVVNAPDAVSVVNSTFSGTLLAWLSAPGDVLGEGDSIASIRSNDLLEIQNQWMLASSALQQASFELRRDEQLFNEGIISQQRLQQTRAHLREAEIEFVGSEERLLQSGFNQTELIDLQQGSISLGVYQVRAPSAGVLSHRAYVTGEIVPAYSELASLQQGDEVWLAAEIPARLAMHLRPGFKLSIERSADSLVMRQKDLVVNEATQTVEVLSAFTGAVNYMPGQVLTLLLPPLEGGVLIPAAAVVRSGDYTTVFVRSPDGVEARRLTIEPAGNNYLARSGIRAGENVVVQGAAVIKGMQLGLGQNE